MVLSADVVARMEKIELNRYVLGMTSLSVGVIFNTMAFIILISTRLVRTSVGLYLVLLCLADLILLVTSACMDQFYQSWIDVDIFYEVGESKVFCQIWVFLQQMSLYWRSLLLVWIVIDRCLSSTRCLAPKGLYLMAIICSAVSFVISAGLAGYWIEKVGELLKDPYTFGSCKIQPPFTENNDEESTWFWFELIAHVVFPSALMYLAVLCGVIALMISGMAKGASEEEDEKGLVLGVTALAWINLAVMTPYLVVNLILLYIERHWQPYDLTGSTKQNLEYTEPLARQFRLFMCCLTFFMLLAVRRFRGALCSD